MTERLDGRRADQLRPLDLQPDFLEQPHGCVLYAQGNTVVHCTATLEEEVRVEEQKDQRSKMEAEQTSAIEAARTPADAGIEMPADPTITRTNSSKPA